jgi:hypothetical protein
VGRLVWLHSEALLPSRESQDFDETEF